ncbi:MAG: hypothetical protein ACXWUG_23440, partial [Polyangiales bacterium]
SSSPLGAEQPMAKDAATANTARVRERMLTHPSSMNVPMPRNAESSGIIGMSYTRVQVSQQ